MAERRAAQAAWKWLFSAGPWLILVVDTALSLSPALFGSVSRWEGYTGVVFRGFSKSKVFFLDNRIVDIIVDAINYLDIENLNGRPADDSKLSCRGRRRWLNNLADKQIYRCCRRFL